MTPTTKTSKVRTIKEFKIFLANECFEGKKYLQGKYDKKIYDWFTHLTN